MAVEVMRTTASVGSLTAGSGTSSTRTSRLPCHTTAFIPASDPLAPPVRQLSAAGRLKPSAPDLRTDRGDARRRLGRSQCGVFDAVRRGRERFQTFRRDGTAACHARPVGALVEPAQGRLDIVESALDAVDQTLLALALLGL